MKKKMLFVMIAVMLALPAALFAGNGLSLGVTALYETGMNFAELEAMAEPPTITSDDLAYGAEARLDLSLFQVSVMAFPVNGIAMGTVNAGVFLDLGIVGLGASGGAWYITDFADAALLEYNAKVNADLMLGPAILSAYVIGTPNVDIAMVDGPEDLEATVGVSALFQF